MIRKEISDAVISIIHEHFGNQPITEETNLESIGEDSLDRVEILMDIEEDFCVDIPDGEHEHIKTVKELVDLVEKKLNEK